MQVDQMILFLLQQNIKKYVTQCSSALQLISIGAI